MRWACRGCTGLVCGEFATAGLSSAIVCCRPCCVGLAISGWQQSYFALSLADHRWIVCCRPCCVGLVISGWQQSDFALSLADDRWLALSLLFWKPIVSNLCAQSSFLVCSVLISMTAGWLLFGLWLLFAHADLRFGSWARRSRLLFRLLWRHCDYRK